MTTWLFVDDSSPEREALASQIADDVIDVKPMSAKEARQALTDASLKPSGILMDIELGNESGVVEDGLSLAAAIRAEQNKGSVPAFPIIRFSRKTKIAEYVGTDSSSDALFDWACDKESISTEPKLAKLRGYMLAFSEIYASVKTAEAIDGPVKLSTVNWDILGHSALSDRFKIFDRVHSRAGLLAKMLVTPGILISEDLLSARLGIDVNKSAGYADILVALSDYRYQGLGGDHVVRWWARGLEYWWEESFGQDDPLAGLSIAERTGALKSKFGDITPLVQDEKSPGDRPWRYCTLTLEKYGEFMSVDPEWGVPMIARLAHDGWEDPLYAALGVALQTKDDPRLNGDALAFLQKRVKTAK
ncbi:hypothetical protein JMG10_25570 [Nostoc ellipsosporum NOK]|nr:hypothetical protein [Nostoc ellipsosporum NOK]